MDRAREAIFNILGDLSGTNVVDLYAGTGAMGIEALSRGAARAVFVEADRAAARVVRENLERLGQRDTATVLEVDVERAGPRLAKLAPFDLVLSDPPWPIAQEAALVVSRLVRGLLAPSARVLMGHPADRPVEVPESSGLVLTDARKWGGTGMSFFEMKPGSE
jgi:16S rRNA (guanine(966)-N(2))-methyltransferase RsmD